PTGPPSPKLGVHLGQLLGRIIPRVPDPPEPLNITEVVENCFLNQRLDLVLTHTTVTTGLPIHRRRTPVVSVLLRNLAVHRGLTHPTEQHTREEALRRPVSAASRLVAVYGLPHP